MELVVDASVIISVLANEPSKERLIELTIGSDLLAPASVHWQIGNAFSAMHKRGRASLDELLIALAIYPEIPIRFVDVELDESLRLASQHNLYAYDAYLLRCAQKYTAPLLSLDNRLNEAAQIMNLNVIEV